jgi:hypothetical protein
MRKALAWTVIAIALLFAPLLRYQTALAMPFAAGAMAIDTMPAPDTVPAQQARLVCGWWWGHFECARICPAAYHRHWRHHHRYYCQPVVLGLPWI